MNDLVIIILVILLICLFCLRQENFQVKDTDQTDSQKDLETDSQKDTKKIKDSKLKKFCQTEYNNCLVNDQLADCRQMIISNNYRCQFIPFPWN
jgi:hypothetical protein